jgi:hypothetical protein
VTGLLFPFAGFQPFSERFKFQFSFKDIVRSGEIQDLLVLSPNEDHKIQKEEVEERWRRNTEKECGVPTSVSGPSFCKTKDGNF